MSQETAVTPKNEQCEAEAVAHILNGDEICPVCEEWVGKDSMIHDGALSGMRKHARTIIRHFTGCLECYAKLWAREGRQYDSYGQGPY